MPSPAAPNSGFGGWQASTRIRQPGCGQIDVWLLLSADYLSRQDSLLNCLNGQERCRAQKKKIPSKKFEYILAQAALRCVLAQVLGIKHDEVSYQRGHKGKPALSALHERPDLHFNISHSSGMMLIAISAAGEVGVDLEGINTSTSIDLVSRRAFSQRECVDLQKPDGRRTSSVFFSALDLQRGGGQMFWRWNSFRNVKIQHHFSIRRKCKNHRSARTAIKSHDVFDITSAAWNSSQRSPGLCR